LQATGTLELRGGTLAVGAAGAVQIGTAGGAETGSLTIDAGHTVVATNSTIGASVIDQGNLVVEVDSAVNGSLTGSGSATIDPGAVLDVSGKLGLAGISFLGVGGAALELGTPDRA